MNRDAIDLTLMAKQARWNSERWFPAIHEREEIDIQVHYGLAIAGEVGELANIIKKLNRYTNAPENLKEGVGSEMADIFTYLLLLCDTFKIDLLEEFNKKQAVCESRWG